jgi:hypothetical protein
MQRVEYLTRISVHSLPAIFSPSSLAPRTVLPDNGAFYNANTSPCTLPAPPGERELPSSRSGTSRGNLTCIPPNGALSGFCEMAATSRSSIAWGCIPACETRYWRPLPLPHVCSPASLGRIPRCRCPHYQTQLSGPPNATWRRQY